MFQTATRALPLDDKPALYRELLLRLGGLFEGERDRIANAANMAALLLEMLPDLNWCGWYFLNGAGDELVVGPFQGRPACVRIAVGRGACGTAVAERRSIIVPDVDAFPGHIACDAASRSELVIPLYRGESIAGVLDLDSPLLGRFEEADRLGLEAATRLFAAGSDW